MTDNVLTFTPRPDDEEDEDSGPCLACKLRELGIGTMLLWPKGFGNYSAAVWTAFVSMVGAKALKSEAWKKFGRDFSRIHADLFDAIDPEYGAEHRAWENAAERLGLSKYGPPDSESS